MNVRFTLYRCGDGLVEYFKGDIDVFFREDERRRPADRAGPASEDDEAAVETRHFDRVAKFGSRRIAISVRNELNAEHQP